MTLLKLTPDKVTPEVARPAPDLVLSGDPVQTTWNQEVRGNLFAGMWHCTVGEWRVTYTEREYVHIREGHSVLTDEVGTQTHLRAGDSYLIRPGFKGTWRVVEPTLKDYVVLTPDDV